MTRSLVNVGLSTLHSIDLNSTIYMPGLAGIRVPMVYATTTTTGAHKYHQPTYRQKAKAPHTQTHTNTHSQMHTHSHKLTHEHILTNLHTNTHKLTHEPTHRTKHTNTHIHTNTDIHTHSHTHTPHTLSISLCLSYMLIT